MKGIYFRNSILLCLILAAAASAQTGINATLSGAVADPTGALIPGVEVTARNVDTGVTATTVTNESGTYRFPSLQPGSYEVNAALPGFQSQTFRLSLGASQQIRQNFTLQVGTVAQAVEVTIAADELLTASTASVGTVLPANQLVDLPLVTRNVMDLAMTLPGVTGEGGSNSTFGGVSANGSANVGISLDGVTMNTGRHTQGLKTTFFVNPDMIDEMRVTVAPVDVEGRGAAQVQMRARAGTNQFRGAATWNIRNSALNANSWNNNRIGASQLWYNRHQTTASLGGPIIKGKTFFFALYDRMDQRQKESVNGLVLTPLARQGIFRFFPGINNGNADTTPSGTGTSRIAAVVDKLGNPLPNPVGATGAMQSFNVFGDALNPGDPLRRRMDPSGYMTSFLQVMPLPNAYDGTVGDGLNTATHRWVRRTVAGSAGGTGENLDAYNRKQINIKIDHNFSQKHRLSGNWVRESHYTDNNQLSNWPTGIGGQIRENPRVRSLQFTSTLTPNILNEFRYAYRLTTLHWDSAIVTPNVKDEAIKYMPVINGYPVYVRPTMFTAPNHVLGAAGDFGNTSPLTTFTDNVSWTKGAHAFKGGIEFRYANTAGYQPTPVTSVTFGLIPTVTGGAGDNPVRGIDTLANQAGQPFLLTSNIALAQNLLLALAGSVASTSMRFETWEPTDTQFLDYKQSYNHPSNPKDTRGKIRENHQNEFNFFFKDDWQLRPNLTLNLGIRWDLYRVSDFRSGTGKNWTRGPIDGHAGYFGISGRTFGEAFHNGGQVKADPTRVVLIGRDSKYPDSGIWPTDHNNFSPAIGFSWAPGFGGKDKTTIRGGFQVAHLLPGNSLSWIDSDSGRLPGLEYNAIDSGGSTYRDFSNVTFPLVVPASIPEVVVPSFQRSFMQNFFSPDYVTPYIMTTTLGITRSLPGGLIADVRYVGTRGVKLHSSINYNEPDFRMNGLMDALSVTRAGGDHPLFDRMFRGLNFGTTTAPLVVGTQITGSEALRRNATFRGNLANGEFRALANNLNTTNIGVAIPAGETIAGATLRSSGLFPENFIVANPQFGTMEMRSNGENSQYHSMQTQITKRTSRGMTLQGTWTWSRSTGAGIAASTGGGPSAQYRDFLNRRADWSVHTFHRIHDIRGYGTYELPFGPGRLLGGNSSGILARLIEGWQFGTIFNLTTGAPLNVGAATTVNTNGTPDIVGDFPRQGKVVWDGTNFGNFFSQPFYRVADPACLGVVASGAANLRTFCTNSAIATDQAGTNIILRNAAPGQLGSLGLRPIYGPGSWDFDANLQKRIRLAETRSLTVRINASNILNHPTPGNPNLNINSGTFGEITTKTGSRTLSGQLRLEF